VLLLILRIIITINDGKTVTIHSNYIHFSFLEFISITLYKFIPLPYECVA